MADKIPEETFSNHEAICPWCGEKQSDTIEYFESGEGTEEMECSSCDKPIIVDFTMLYCFITNPGKLDE